MSREIYDSHLDLIQDVIEFVRRRHRFQGAEGEDFASQVHLKLIENDCRVLSQFKGRSHLRTYLIAVVLRIGLDYRIAKWGKWRPSAQARRMGELAVRLETLCSRDGFPVDEAIETIRMERPEEAAARIEEIADQLPVRTRTRIVGEETLDHVAAEGDPEKILIKGAAKHQTDQILSLLRSSMERLEPEERLLLKLHFESGLSWIQIARRVGLGQKEVYREKEKALAKLRKRMEEEGFDAEGLSGLLVEAEI